MSGPRILHVPGNASDEGALRQAAEVLEAGGVIAFPTETVYGIGCLESNREGIERIYSVKGREHRKPLAVYLPDPDSVREIAGKITASAEKLIRRFLPGPLTLILPDIRGEAIGYRVSSNLVLRELLGLISEPMLGTSANRSGERDSTSAEEVAESVGWGIDAIIDSGTCAGAIPSTVVDCTSEPPGILREGLIAAVEIEVALK